MLFLLRLGWNTGLQQRHQGRNVIRQVDHLGIAYLTSSNYPGVNLQVDALASLALLPHHQNSILPISFLILSTNCGLLFAHKINFAVCSGVIISRSSYISSVIARLFPFSPLSQNPHILDENALTPLQVTLHSLGKI